MGVVIENKKIERDSGLGGCKGFTNEREREGWVSQHE